MEQRTDRNSLDIFKTHNAKGKRETSGKIQLRFKYLLLVIHNVTNKCTRCLTERGNAVSKTKETWRAIQLTLKSALGYTDYATSLGPLELKLFAGICRLTVRYLNLQSDSPTRCLPCGILKFQALFIPKDTEPIFSISKISRLIQKECSLLLLLKLLKIF